MGGCKDPYTFAGILLSNRNELLHVKIGMRIFLLFFLAAFNIVSVSAKFGPYTKIVEQRVAWAPEAGQNGPSMTVLIRIKHDAFFGDANESHIAGKYELGAYVIYKGQRINTATLPDDVKAKIKFSSVDICYDIEDAQTKKVVSTKCKGIVMTSDFPGSPNWDKMFPGLSADRAKALYKSGYNIINIRVTKLSYSFPNLDAYLNGSTSGGGTQTSPPSTTLDWQAVSYARKGDTLFIKYSNGSIEKHIVCGNGGIEGGSGNSQSGNDGSYNGGDDNGGPNKSKCPPPFIRVNVSGRNYCASVSWSCPEEVRSIMMGADGNIIPQKQDPQYRYVSIEYREAGDRAWKVFRGTCTLLGAGIATDITGLKACTKYEIRARAMCEDSTFTAYSELVGFETGCDPSYSGIRAENITSNSAQIRYLVKGGGCYNRGTEEVTIVEYSVTGSNWQQVEHINGPLTLKNLEAGKSYKVRLKARFPNGKFSPYSREYSFQTLR
jgi:hypothetical protein